LTWKTRVQNWPRYAPDQRQMLDSISRVADAMNERQRSLNGSKVLGLGVAYKRDTSDVRNARAGRPPVCAEGAIVGYADPHVPCVQLNGKRIKSLALTADVLSSMDCVVLLTDHSTFDYEMIAAHSRLILDCRNAFKNFPRSKIVAL
jgi:UDP-N-acetyl-D-glucosamine dehydrogenase